MCHVYKPVERGVGLAGPFRFRPEYFLLLDVIVDADAVLDINDRREVAVVLVLRVDVQVNDFVLLDDHQERIVLLDAGAVVAKSVSGSAHAREAERVGDLWREEAELFAPGFLARVGHDRLQNWMVNLWMSNNQMHSLKVQANNRTSQQSLKQKMAGLSMIIE